MPAIPASPEAVSRLKSERRPLRSSAEPGKAESRNTDKAPLCVFAFSAGALDATMQIGTIHALMLANVKPNVVLGVSAGAINAVVLGEVMNAWEEPAEDETLTDDEREKIKEQNKEHRDAARAGRFLQLLEVYRETPMELMRCGRITRR